MDNFYRAYDFFGCHWTKKGYRFRLYAPNAISVHVVGDFNEWNVTKHPMVKNEHGVFETVIKSAMELDQYKYYIEANGKKYFKADPFAFYGDHQNNKNSRIYSLDEFKWHDRGWKHTRCDCLNKPMNIYEVHLGSWRRDENNHYLNYREIADELIPYVKKMGYTHIELMPITEFPYDGSWGYQVSGYFSVTSRFGEPYDFMYFVDLAHHHHIGVILDWVPAHFPKDAEGLYEFDGTFLYEAKEETRREHLEWGTRIFDYGDSWVQSFLISSASFFFDLYHIDGLRVDAVSSMLYLDYNRKKWKPNHLGGNHNLEAIDFLQRLNTHIFLNFPSILMIAEESTAFEKVTTPVHLGGLGFNYKWNMGWMNDTLSFIASKDRYQHHNKITFSFMYAHAENYILPLSHDEVVHGKKSIVDRMPGNYDQKFQHMRTYYGYMMAHPGKKLTFMGNEIAQFIEWDYGKSLDWILLKYPKHTEMQRYFRDIHKLYLHYAPFWELDTKPEGFSWINGERCLIFKRFSNDKKLLFVINFFSEAFINYHIAIETEYELIFFNNETKYGGDGKKGDITISQNKIIIDIQPLSFYIFKPTNEKGEDL